MTDEKNKLIKANESTLEKRILVNMEKVIKSISKKKKCKKKHKHKNAKKLNFGTEDISQSGLNVFADSKIEAMPSTSNDYTHTLGKSNLNNKNGKRLSNPAKRKSNDKISPNSSLIQTDLGSNGFTISKKIDNTANLEKCNVSVTTPTPTALNAFDVLMNSRNKSIGSNSSGKTLNEETTEVKSPEFNEAKNKRKQVLENWAAEKGGLKRKLYEDSKDEFIQHEMNKRSKRFKKIITGAVNVKKDVIVNTPKSRKMKKSIGKKPTRPLSSDDSDESEVNSFSEVLDEFVDKLASPLKKRDNILGYFDKVGRSTDSTKEKKINLIHHVHTPKKRGRPRKKIDVEVKSVVEEETVSTITRPRRLGSSKIKSYDFDYDFSPEKPKTPSRSDTNCIVSPLKIINIHSPRPLRVIKSHSIEINDDDDNDDNVENLLPEKNVKLAPLFNRTMPKALIDPEQLKLRDEFLKSGMPEKLRLKIKNKKLFDDTILLESPIFPLISHVQQNSNTSDNLLNYTVSSKFKYLDLEDGMDVYELPAEYRTLQLGTLTDCKSIAGQFHLTNPPPTNDLRKLDQKEVVLKFKQSYDNFPVFRCFKQMILRTVENKDSLFTEKYKPLTMDDILVNISQAKQLKKFLSSWLQNEDSSSVSRNPSDDDFESSNMSASTIINNFIVLIGPPSSGKTLTVSALANELNFNILEINLSTKRNGKKILQELQEATQSHQVRSQEDGINRKNIFKQRLGITQSQDSNSSNHSVTNGTKKMSLILIEDADIVFEQDDGFVGAINQLIATSKRPVVLTATNNNSNHLSKFIQQNSFNFKVPNTKNITKWLSVLSVCEHFLIDLNDIEKLLEHNNYDLRKTINEMQFFIQSGGDRNISPDDTNPTHKRLYKLFTKNQNRDHRFRFPLNFNNVWCNMSNKLHEYSSIKSDTENNNVQKESQDDEFENLLFMYENMSSASMYQNKLNTDRIISYVDEEISHYLVEETISHFSKSLPAAENLGHTDCNREKNNRPLLTSYLQTSNLKQRSTFVDYEPIIRNMCRSEKNRMIPERRPSRFYHYLRNIISINTFSTDIFDNYCTVLFD